MAYLSHPHYNTGSEENKMNKKILPIIALSGYAVAYFGCANLQGKLNAAENKIITLREIQGKTIEKNAVMITEIEKLRSENAVMKAELNNEINQNTRIDMPITDIAAIPDETFRNVAINYLDVDPGFAYAMFLLETARGTSEVWVNHNNPAGIITLDGSGEYRHYDSKEEGIDAMFHLIQYYAVNGRNTPLLLRQVWAEEPRTDEIIDIWREVHGGNGNDKKAN